MIKRFKRFLLSSFFYIRLFFRRLNAKTRVLPNFLIIGAQKSGTTSLYLYLTKHPNIIPAAKKEIHYFDLNSKKTESWYRAFFPREAEMFNGRITGEASPQYMFIPGVLPRLKALLPNVKIIIILRNPVTRAYSHYQHQLRMGRETISFEEAIEAESSRILPGYKRMMADEDYVDYSYMHFSYLERGKYYDQVLTCFNHFKKENILIIQSEKFNRNPKEEYDKIISFLGLSPHPIDFPKKYKEFKYPPMNETTRQKLNQFFEPYNEKLFELIGEQFDW